MSKKVKKAKKNKVDPNANGVRQERPPGPFIESPTWGQLHKMSVSVMEALGGPAGAAHKLNGESFYALTILSSLNLDEAKANAPIFGTRYLT